MDVKTTVITALGAVGLFLLGLVTELVRSWLSQRAADGERAERRSFEFQDRRNAFELETLVQLETALEASLMVEIERLAAFQTHLKSAGVWNDSKVTRETSEAALLATRELSRLRARLFDDELSQMILGIQTSLRACAALPDEGVTDIEAGARAEATWTAVTKELREVDQRIGRRIRELHENLA